MYASLTGGKYLLSNVSRRLAFRYSAGCKETSDARLLKVLTIARRRRHIPAAGSSSTITTTTNCVVKKMWQQSRGDTRIRVKMGIVQPPKRIVLSINESIPPPIQKAAPKKNTRMEKVDMFGMLRERAARNGSGKKTARLELRIAETLLVASSPHGARRSPDQATARALTKDGAVQPRASPIITRRLLNLFPNTTTLYKSLPPTSLTKRFFRLSSTPPPAPSTPSPGNHPPENISWTSKAEQTLPHITPPISQPRNRAASKLSSPRRIEQVVRRIQIVERRLSCIALIRAAATPAS
ncbi:hypothetical protein CC78DRAFT_584837 [Lojkania enalia]|uniref:Uncharacterized protein n=1 Tax=Lojkania enalia TaxID=147567 RepID=A0A9P4K344_9PLEO|nr:hypothetical protein CC78DRAFT_584837 [Didymosphaeria enalia]